MKFVVWVKKIQVVSKMTQHPEGDPNWLKKYNCSNLAIDQNRSKKIVKATGASKAEAASQEMVRLRFANKIISLRLKRK